MGGADMMAEILPILVALYGAVAGVLMFRLKPTAILGPSEERVLVAAGWTVSALSLTLAVALILFLLAGMIAPFG